MRINIKNIDQVTVVEMTGELDSTTAPAVQNQILPLAQDNRHIVLDMSGTLYMSSAGLRTLLLLYRQISSGSGRIVLAGLSDEIKDTMNITGFLNFFRIYDTVALATEALKSS
ncbi:MAG: anti-sigma factor antagonist [Chloroflexi bacterium]|nr:anti-sigma factor antagonist [Chloroflexota bacterium]